MCFRGEAGVVFGEMDDCIFAGDVRCADDGELRPVDGGVERDAADAAAGNGAANGGSVPHAGEREVVNVFGRAQDFGAAFLADG